MSLITKSIKESGYYSSGTPFMKNSDWKKNAVAFKRLHGLIKSKIMEVEINIEEIQEFLPHRYPMLLVDRVTHMVLGESVTAYKNITTNEPFFMGHFPGKQVMPGVLIVEAMAQASGILVLKQWIKSLKMGQYTTL